MSDDRLDDIEIAILELAQRMEGGAWIGTYEHIYGLLRPAPKDK